MITFGLLAGTALVLWARRGAKAEIDISRAVSAAMLLDAVWLIIWALAR
jgi:hypothetical protein